MASIDTATDPIARVRRSARKSAPQPAVEQPRLGPRRGDSPWFRRALVFAACVLAVDALFGDWGLAQTIRAQRDYEQTAYSLSRLRSDNAGLREQVRRLQSDPAAIEEVARRELGLIRRGEILIVVTDQH
jgi:cell division protein FtsB